MSVSKIEFRVPKMHFIQIRSVTPYQVHAAWLRETNPVLLNNVHS